jgi:2'-5' RNA ligase
VISLKNRAIVIFPEFENSHVIEQLREQFDPLAGCIAAHITLVFPFESRLSEQELAEHVHSIVAPIPPFEITLHGISRYGGEYLFLNVKRGNDAIIELHDRLYSGLLSGHESRAEPYVPHITVGRLTEQTQFARALEAVRGTGETFGTWVNRVHVVRAGAARQFVIESSADLWTLHQGST